MRCEVVREGQACNNTAELIVRTPWTTQLACIGCATSFERYQTEKLEFFCDWPLGGRECGEPATHYVQIADIGIPVYQRPLCGQHKHVIGAKPIDDDRFSPKLVPHKPPAQPPPRVVVGGPNAGLWCHCGAAGKYRPGVETMPLCDEHFAPPSETKPSPVAQLTPRASIRDALEDVALTAIRVLKEKIEKWR